MSVAAYPSEYASFIFVFIHFYFVLWELLFYVMHGFYIYVLEIDVFELDNNAAAAAAAENVNR